MLAGFTYFLILYVSDQVILVGSIECYKCVGCPTVGRNTSTTTGCKGCITAVERNETYEKSVDRYCSQYPNCAAMLGGHIVVHCCHTDRCNSGRRPMGYECYHCYQNECPVIDGSTLTITECAGCQTNYYFYQWGSRKRVKEVQRFCMKICDEQEIITHDPATGLLYSVKNCCKGDKCNSLHPCYNCTNCGKFHESLPYAWNCGSCATIISKSGVVDRTCVADQCQSKKVKDNVVQKCCRGDYCNNEDGLSFEKELEKLEPPNIKDNKQNDANKRSANMFFCLILSIIFVLQVV